MIIAPWIRAKMEKHGIIEIDRNIYDWLLYKWELKEDTPIERFFFVGVGNVVAVDNLNGCFWQEEFRTVSKAVKWLCGEYEVKS